MSQAAHATLFNLSKKCVQLEKVAAKMFGLLEEKNLHKEIILKLMDDTFEQIRNNYDKHVKKLYENLSKDIANDMSIVKEEYYQKVSKYRLNFLSEEETLFKQTAQIAISNSDEICEVKDTIAEMNNEMKTKEFEFNKKIEEQQKMILQRLSQIRKTNEESIQKENKENIEKEMKYKAEKDTEMNKYAKEQENEIQSLKGKIKQQQEFESNFRTFLQNKRKELEQFKIITNEIQKEVNTMKTLFEKNNDPQQHKFSQIIQVYHETKHKIHNELQEYEQLYRTAEHKKEIIFKELINQKEEFEQQRNNLLHNYEILTSKLDKEIQKIQKEKQELAKTQKTQFENKENENNNNQTLQLTQINQIKTENEKQENDIKTEYKTEETKLKDKLQSMKNILQQKQNEFTKEENEIKKTLQQENYITSQTKNNKIQENQQKLVLKRKEYENYENQYTKQFKLIQSLKKEKQDAFEKANQDIKIINEQHQQKVNKIQQSISKLFETESKTIQARLDIKYKQTEDECEEKIQSVLKEKRVAQKRLENNLEQKHNFEMMKIRTLKPYESGEIALTNSKYKTEYDILFKQYSEIMPPSNKNLSTIEKRTQSLTNELNSIKQQISSEKNLLTGQWEKEINAILKKTRNLRQQIYDDKEREKIQREEVKKLQTLLIQEKSNSLMTINRVQVKRDIDLMKFQSKIDQLKKEINSKVNEKQTEIDTENQQFSYISRKLLSNSPQQSTLKRQNTPIILKPLPALQTQQTGVNSQKMIKTSYPNLISISRINKIQLDNELMRLKKQIEIKQMRFQNEIKNNENFYNSQIEQQNHIYLQEIQSIKRSANEITNFLDEKISVYEEEIENFKNNMKSTKDNQNMTAQSRTRDIEAINRLTKNLMMLNIELRNKTLELSNSKSSLPVK